jgi:phospholipid/cholesterol/gamma-HCH transport system ATP-binding protein
VTARLIRRRNDALGASSVVVTHDVAETFRIADTVAVMAPSPTGARLVAMGTPQALQASDDPYLQQFLQGHEQGPVGFHYPASDIAEALLPSRPGL